MIRLSTEQRQAVTALGSVLVHAGAGSGKTAVLSARILHLFEQGTSPNQIVAVTYTEAAAAELRRRVRDAWVAQGRPAEALSSSVIGTVHHLASLIARAHPLESGAPLKLAVLDEAASALWHAAHLPHALAQLSPTLVGALPPELRDPWLLHLLTDPARAQAGFGIKTPPEIWEQPDHATALGALRALFGQVQPLLQSWRTEQGVGTFADLELWALRALAFPQVRAWCAARWTHLLLDEAQDANPVQWQLLQRLWHPDASLTAVGDAQQGIYGFRGADVRVLGEIRQAILARGGEEITLDTTYRMVPGLLASLNGALTRVMPSPTRQRAGAVPFIPLRPGRTDSIGQSVFEVMVTEGEHAGERAQGEARTLARRVAQLLQDQTLVRDPATGESRPARSGDVAVLLRSRTHQAAYVAALRAEGIPCTPVGGRELYRRPEVLDAAAFLQFLADPTDDLALLAVLRGPGVGLPDAHWFTLWSARMGSSLWARVQADPACVQIVSWLSALLVRRSAYSAARLVWAALGRSGALQVHAAQSDGTQRLANLQVFMTQLRTWAQAGDRDVVRAAARLRPLLEGGHAALEASGTITGVVQVMTIHASKGLEFPIVVLPHLRHDLRGPLPTILLDPEQGIGLALPGRPSAALQRLRADQQIRERLEAERVRYVALTRAADHLLIGIQATRGQLPTVRTYAAAFAAAGAVWAAGPAEGATSRRLDSVTLTLPDTLPITALRVYQACPRQFMLRYVQGAVPSPLGGGTRQDQAVSAGDVGTVVHLALWRDWDEAKLQDFVWDWDIAAQHEAQTLIAQFRQHPAFAGVQRRARREVPIMLSVGTLVLRGQVDAYSPTDSLVLDFKTDQVIEPERHLLQVAAYAQYLGARRAALAYLRQGVLHEFTPEQLHRGQQELREIADKVAGHAFDPIPSAQVCPTCPFRALCPAMVQTTVGHAAA
jgi:ATP-dependent helicase/nuclease subunit A